MINDPDGQSEEKTLNTAIGDLEQYIEDVQNELLPWERQDAVRRLEALVDLLNGYYREVMNEWDDQAN